ncbi:unnamed protein product [Schistosoma turkestanicum]|nr:unnamed protein product [Schistosoma turkestanicum]
MNIILSGTNHHHHHHHHLFTTNFILRSSIITHYIQSSYMTHYLYLLILLTEVNCRKQLNSNITSTNGNNPIMIHGISTINKPSLLHDTMDSTSPRAYDDSGRRINSNNNNNNDPVGSVTLQLAFIVIEEVKIGSLIGNLLDKLHLHNPNWLMTTHSSNNNNKNNNNNLFVNLKPIPYVNLNQTTGDLTVRARIDRETLCDTMGTCCHLNRPMDWSTNNDNHNNHNKLQIMNNDKYLEQLSMISSDCALRMLILYHTDSEQFLEIIIYILDINDNPPRWIQSVIELEIPEHTTIGTGYQLPEAIDPDQGPMHTVVAYELENKLFKKGIDRTSRDYYYSSSSLSDREELQDQKPFSLDVRVLDSAESAAQKFSLKLRIEEDLDRETHPTYELMLYAIDGGETVQAHAGRHYTPTHGIYSPPNISNRHTGSVLIRVLLMDKNDNAPVFKNPNQIIVIPENTKPGTVIYQAIANDLDSSDQNSLVYKIGPSASAEVLRCFRLNPDTGELILIMPLSYQNASILSADSGSSNIVVNNSNNRLLDSVSNNLPLIGHRIPIQVSDQIHITKMTLIVSIRKINMNPPTIHIASHLRLSSRGNHIWLSEDAQLGSLVAMINVVDSDDLIPQSSRSNQLMVGKEVRSECRSKHDSFEIVPLHTMTNSDFKLLLKKSLDREVKPSHNVKIECWDSGEPPLTAETSILIQVDDVNDSPPLFDRPFYYAKIKEGLDPSTPIIQVHASDADLGINSEIIYRLVAQEYTLATALPDSLCSSMNSLHTEHNLISINENTGELMSQIALDRESIALINCTVEAINRNQLYLTDNDNNNKRNVLHKTSTQIIITIDDLNDCKPMFNESSYEFTVVEGQKSHYQIGRVYAVDCDAELSNRIVRYSMRPSPGTVGQMVKLYVYISFEGIIYTHQTTDREQTPVLTFEVIATDTGNPPLSAVTSVLIRILDTNDNSPVWIFPKQFGANSVINISQHSTVGLLIAQLKAIDIDEGLNGEVVYSIVHGNDDGLFEVDSMSGTLYLIRSLHHLIQPMHLKSFTKDELNNNNNTILLQTGEILENPAKFHHEQIHSYRLLLKAQDRGTPPRHNTTVLYVAIIPAQFDKQSYTTDRTSMESMMYHQQTDVKRQSDSSIILDFKRMDRDLIVMIVLIALTLIISVILIVTIFLIRCRHLLCIMPFRRQTHHNRNNNTNNHTITANNNNSHHHPFTLENHTIQSNNRNACEFIRDQWWNKLRQVKTLPKEYCTNKSGGDLLSTSSQEMYRASTLEHCPEFNLLRSVQNTASNSPCDHILLKDSTYRTINPNIFKHNNPQPCTNLSCVFNPNSQIIHNPNNHSKYNTISAINNSLLTNDFMIEMNHPQLDENPYTLLKTSDMRSFCKDAPTTNSITTTTTTITATYQPLYSTSSKQLCLTPIIYEHNNTNSSDNNNDENEFQKPTDTLNKSLAAKINHSEKQQFSVLNNCAQLNDEHRK